MKINYFFRHPDVGYSIQRVFQTVNQKISENLIIEEWFLPSTKSNISSIIKNGLFAKKHQGNINHITGDAHYLLLFLSSKNSLVTVHDIMYYSYLKGFKKKIWKLLYIDSLKRANKVVFISEFAKDQVIKEINLPFSKYCIIPNPVSPEFSNKTKIFNHTKPTILHIGAHLERKNLGRTILALKDISCHIRIVGKINKSNAQLLIKHNMDYSNVSNLNNTEIVNEYENCDIVNFPSLFEGFGMPIIEGQAVGRPVVTSNIAPMKQVAGDGAMLVDPYNIDDIKLAYLKIIDDEEFRYELIKKGLDNVKQYKVNIIAEQYIKLYKEINN